MCVHIYIYIPLHLIIYPDNQIKWLAINVIKPHEPMNHDLHIISPFEIRCWQKNNDRWPPGHHTGQWTTHHLVRGFSHSKLHWVWGFSSQVWLPKVSNIYVCWPYNPISGAPIISVRGKNSGACGVLRQLLQFPRGMVICSEKHGG